MRDAAQRDPERGPATRRRVAAWGDRLFGVDLRSLAVFRIALAGVLLFDLVDRLGGGGLVAHYTERGVVPRDIAGLLTGGAALSLHRALAESAAAQGALFGLAGLAAVALGVGYRTRLATATSWVLLASLHLANPMVASEGADMLLRILLLWGIFLPLGARWSVDARRSRAPAAGPGRALSFATAGILLQVGAVYWIAAIAKHGDTWRQGTALHYALHIDYWGNAAGAWLREQEALLPWLTYGSLGLEALGPFLAFVPVWTPVFRLLAIASFWGFHLGIWIFMTAGMFSALSMTMWLVFLPTAFWDRLPATRAAPAPAGAPGPGVPRLLHLAAAVPLAYLLLALASYATRPLLGAPAPLPPPVAMVGKALRMEQRWSMFAPNPSRVDYWPAVKGRLAGGDSVDVLRDEPFSWETQHPGAADFPSFKWRLYFHGLFTNTYVQHRGLGIYEPLVDYLCRRWNASHDGPQRLESVQLIWTIERIHDDRVAPPARNVGHVQKCPR